MPSAVAHNRISLAETSLDFRYLTPEDLERHIDSLNNTLLALRNRQIEVWVHPWLWDGIECLDDTPLCDFLYGTIKNDEISRDTRLLLISQLDRCTSWDEDEAGSMDAVTIHQPDSPEHPTACDPAFSIGIALEHAGRGHNVACLVFPTANCHGFCQVRGQGDNAEIFFFSDPDELDVFWRSLFSLERIRESHFFELAELAFPKLVLHPSLNFRHFEGRYVDLYGKTVQILSAVNDHFATIIESSAGIPHEISAKFGAFGVDLSPESPKTRGSTTLMAHRMVHLNEQGYCCEWHAKLEPHRNRIHFSLPARDLGGRIVIGRFTVHLPT